jgi:hypothetical protein
MISRHSLIIKCYMLLVLVVAFIGCIKDNGNSQATNHPVTKPTIVGNWSVDYYVAANIYLDNNRSDTTYPINHATYNFTKDSLFADQWYVAGILLPTTPQHFATSQANEYFYSDAYSFDGSYIYDFRGANIKDTLNVITFTDHQLIFHGRLPPGYGYYDSYVILKK